MQYQSVSEGGYRFGWLYFSPVHVMYALDFPVSVFMSPETAVCPPWRGIFQSPYFKQHLALVAVDEAHCIPEW